MKSINRASGLRITMPDDFTVTEPATKPAGPSRRTARGRVFGAVPMPQVPGTGPASSDAVVEAFANQDMELVDEVELTPEAAAPGSTRRRGPGVTGEAADTELALTVSANEDAVVLLEQDGMYSWQLPTATTTEPVPAARRGVRAVAPARIITFSITLPQADTPRQRSAKRGMIGDFVLGRVKAFVFKFAARIVLGQAIKYLERNVRRGLVNMAEIDPAKWNLFADPAPLRLPQDRAARVLLFVHGTFSSTIGGYGAMTATPWGEEFLRAAYANYDAVIGFDHPTLSDDPLENATDLLTRLQSIAWPHPPRFDVIAHSRGGLVVRTLTERLLPMANFPATVERIIFVAATNSGTQLAEPDNWQALIDLYTNLSVAACRLIGMMPQAKPVTLVLNEVVKGLGAFVKYLATTAVTDRVVPGLAAMEPDGDFVRKLNEEQPNQPSIAQSYYCAITSEFEPKIFGGEHEPKELPRRFVQWVVDVLVDQLMKESNDLVVNTASMGQIDPQLGKYIKDSLDFGPNPQVYHTNYFVRPEVVNALTRWLRLVKSAAPEPAVVVSPKPRTMRGGGARASDIYVPGAMPRHPDEVEIGGMITPEVPAAVDTDIYVTSAATPSDEAIAEIEVAKPSYVVVRRQYEGEMLHYAFATEEVLDRGRGTGSTELINSLNLHETDASGTRSSSSSMEPPAMQGGPLTTHRAVILENDRPIGVLPEKRTLPSGEDLVKLAQISAAPKVTSDFVVARRTMPTFASAGPATAAIAPSPPRRTRSAIPRAANGGASGAPAAPPKVTCHFRAEMDQEVTLKKPVTVEVTVSREIIGQLIHAAAAESKAVIDPTRKLLIQVLPKQNFQSVDDDFVEIDPPSPNVPQQLYFILKGTHEGEGEVWVIARQGQVPLVTLVLKPRIVTAASGNARRSTASAATAEAPKLSAPLHQLTINEQRNGTEIFYEYFLQSPELKLLKRGKSQPLVGNRETYVASLYKEIENRWLSNKNDVDDFMEELRAIGAAMFDELIPADVQQALWKHRDDIKSIMVIAEEPFIPWELVHLSEPGQPLSKETRFLGQMGLVRWLYEAGWPPEQLRIRKDKARYVIPHYPHPDYVLPEAEQEYQFLEHEFGATSVEPKSDAVRKLLSEPGSFDLLHFACHGVADQDNIANAQLLMEGRVEGSSYIPDHFSATTAEAHANLRSDGAAPIIVLNACQAGRAGYKLTGIGGFARAFLRRGAGAFIGTLWSVGDSPAREFTEEFYLQLKSGRTVAEAAVAAREKARSAGDATWLAYVVYGHPHAKLTA
ncbi:MAG TPA: CHAT domain-containing protein [Chthoniobacterales bacterium]|nr:CHAT domain-containing protein [Chthoniobacterales bacterium]